MSEQRWEELYQKGETGWDKGEASPGLVDFLKRRPELPRGTVLVPGCGTGHDVRAWAGAGFEAVGMDLAPSAIQLARERTSTAGLTAEFRLGNFLSEAPVQKFDYLFEHTLFCAIEPTERDRYVKAARRAIKEDSGRYLANFYLITDKDGPPYGTTREEIRERFSGDFELLEEWTPRSWPNRAGLEWMTTWKPL
jgi:cyclopropane fatty-acyl-phospholipid synthase-like methyltransferase